VTPAGEIATANGVPPSETCVAPRIGCVAPVGGDTVAGGVHEFTFPLVAALGRRSGALTSLQPIASPESAKMGRIAGRAKCARLAAVAIGASQSLGVTNVQFGAGNLRPALGRTARDAAPGVIVRDGLVHHVYPTTLVGDNGSTTAAIECDTAGSPTRGNRGYLGQGLPIQHGDRAGVEQSHENHRAVGAEGQAVCHRIELQRFAVTGREVNGIQPAERIGGLEAKAVRCTGDLLDHAPDVVPA